MFGGIEADAGCSSGKACGRKDLTGIFRGNGDPSLRLKNGPPRLISDGLIHDLERALPNYPHQSFSGATDQKMSFSPS
jgi:hypothetical protein